MLLFQVFASSREIMQSRSTPREAEYEGEIDPQRPSLLTSPTRKKDPHSGKIAGAQKGGKCPTWGC